MFPRSDVAGDDDVPSKDDNIPTTSTSLVSHLVVHDGYLAGWIKKFSPAVGKGWQKRFFCLLERDAALAYWRKKPTYFDEQPQGSISLASIKAVELNGGLGLILQTLDRDFQLLFPNPCNKDVWYHRLVEHVSRAHAKFSTTRAEEDRLWFAAQLTLKRFKLRYSTSSLLLSFLQPFYSRYTHVTETSPGMGPTTDQQDFKRALLKRLGLYAPLSQYYGRRSSFCCCGESTLSERAIQICDQPYCCSTTADECQSSPVTPSRESRFVAASHCDERVRPELENVIHSEDHDICIRERDTSFENNQIAKSVEEAIKSFSPSLTATPWSPAYPNVLDFDGASASPTSGISKKTNFYRGACDSTFHEVSSDVWRRKTSRHSVPRLQLSNQSSSAWVPQENTESSSFFETKTSDFILFQKIKAVAFIQDHTRNDISTRTPSPKSQVTPVAGDYSVLVAEANCDCISSLPLASSGQIDGAEENAEISALSPFFPRASCYFRSSNPSSSSTSNDDDLSSQESKLKNAQLQPFNGFGEVSKEQKSPRQHKSPLSAASLCDASILNSVVVGHLAVNIEYGSWMKAYLGLFIGSSPVFPNPAITDSFSSFPYQDDTALKTARLPQGYYINTLHLLCLHLWTSPFSQISRSRKWLARSDTHCEHHHHSPGHHEPLEVIRLRRCSGISPVRETRDGFEWTCQELIKSRRYLTHTSTLRLRHLRFQTRTLREATAFYSCMVDCVVRSQEEARQRHHYQC